MRRRLQAEAAAARSPRWRSPLHGCQGGLPLPL